MTREEAKTHLIAMKAKFEILLSMRGLEISDVFDVAIEALSAEPCGDAVSRQAVIDTTFCNGISCNECSFITLEDGKPVCSLYERVMKLPPVTPKQKTGHWVRVTDDAGYLVWECDKCGWQQIFTTNFCPNCGAKMAESQESEGE